MVKPGCRVENEARVFHGATRSPWDYENVICAVNAQRLYEVLTSNHDQQEKIGE